MALKSKAAHGKDTRTAACGVELQHRHFAIIAATLKASKPEPHWDANKMAQWVVTVHRFRDTCAASNPKFDEARFMAACDAQA